MTLYYVRKTGNDANNGTSPSTAWLTIGKALSATGIGNGDHAYVGAGRYGEVVNIGMVSPTVETKITGDVDGSHTGDAGEVIWTGYTAGDLATPSSSINLTLGAHNFLTFENICFFSGANGIISYGGGATPTNITFTNCSLYAVFCANANVVFLAVAANTRAAWTFDRCQFFIIAAQIAALRIDPATSSVSDYDMGIAVKNSIFTLGTGYAIRSIPSGALAFKPGGLRMDNCTVLGGAQAVLIGNANWSTTYPLYVYESLLLGQNQATLGAGATGQLIEDYNIISSVTPRTNVAIGTHSFAGNPPSLSPALEVGQSTVSGRDPRAYGTPIAEGAVLGFGQQTGGPSIDLFGDPRPLGGQILPACGALERRNTGVEDTSVEHAGKPSIRLDGPGCEDIEVPVVNGVATTITVWAQYNASYTGPLPSIAVQADAGLGIALTTATMTAGSGTWQQLSVTVTPNFVVSGSGAYAILRLLSSSTAVAGSAYFADSSVSG